jgi:hypothetical protein
VVNQSELFMGMLNELAKMTNTQVGPMMLALYDKALSQYGYDKLISCIEKIVTERSHRDPLPSIKDFKKLLGDDPRNDEDNVEEITERLWCAITPKFGHSGNQKEVRAYVGEIGWHVITMNSGWVAFCESTDNVKDKTFWMAAMRKQVAHAFREAQNGRLGTPPDTPRSLLGGGVVSSNEQLQTNNKIIQGLIR